MLTAIPDSNGITTGMKDENMYADTDATTLFSTATPHTDAGDNLFKSPVGGGGGDRIPMVVSSTSAGSGDSEQQVFLTEGFDDGKLSSRGWYDKTNLPIDNTNTTVAAVRRC